MTNWITDEHGNRTAITDPKGNTAYLGYDALAVYVHKDCPLNEITIEQLAEIYREGGKISKKAVEDIVEIITIGGEEWLFMKAFPVDCVFIRGTTADTRGNVTMEREALTLEVLALAMAARNSGGHTLVQVERVAEAGTLHPRQVKIPGILVDCVVVARPENHCQTFATDYNPAFSCEIRVPAASAVHRMAGCLQPTEVSGVRRQAR